MNRILFILLVFLTVVSNLQAQTKFTLTPEKVTTGKSEVASNFVGFEAGWNRGYEYNKLYNRKYNLLGVTEYYERDRFSNFEIEEIATKRKIVYVRSNGEIIKGIRSIYISKGEKIIHFYYDAGEIFFDIQTGKELSGFNNPNFFAGDKYTIVQVKNDYYSETGNGYVFDIEKNDNDTKIDNEILWNEYFNIGKYKIKNHSFVF
jgi:hypothetical protein